MSSNLTGQFIANTFQNLLQIDSTNTQNSTTILNGIGQVSTKVTIDSNSDGNGGLFIKDGQTAGRVMGIQYVDSSGGEAGLNFWTPGSINANLFLRRTGTAWVGYNDGGSVNIPADVATYSLYVKDGIQVGDNTTGNNGRINLIGSNPLENGAGMFINGEHPFLICRFSHGDVAENEVTKKLKINGQNVSVSDWSAMVVGIHINHDGSQTFRQIDDWRCICVDDGGFWAVNLRYKLQGGDIQEFPRIDILFIKKGLYNDFRNSIVDIT